MDTSTILSELDQYAADFNFPILDNAYVEFGAARLTAFLSEQHWLVVFEVLGFSTKELAFVDDIYAFGSCIEKKGFIGEEILLSPSSEDPLFDKESNLCVADWSNWSISVKGDMIAFAPTRDQYAQAGIDVSNRPAGPGTITEIELLRFLVHHLGESRLFLSDHALLTSFPACKNLSKFIQTTQWQHPDISGEEKPSHNVSIRSLMEALSKRDATLFDSGCPNTHWRCWAQTS